MPTCPGCGATIAVALPGVFAGACGACLVKPVLTAERREVGGYELLDEIGRGGMGVVYRARQKGLDRIVAVKVLAEGVAGADLEREAKAVARLRHPNIVAVHDAGSNYIAMDFIAGRPLAVPQPAKRAAEIVAKVARAVHHAHRMGIVHRDLKPGNILLDEDGEPHVADFGLAKEIGSATTLGAVGTPAYMSPEQALGHAIDPRTDVYGLGAVLHACLTGRAPAAGATVGEVVRSVIDGETPRVPGELGAVCAKALEKDRRLRYPTAEAMAEDLERFVRGEPVEARPISSVGRLWRKAARSPILVAAVVVAVTCAAVAGVLMVRAAREASVAGRVRSALEEGRRAMRVAATLRGREEAQRRWAEAERRFADGLALAPEHPELHLEMARLRMARADWEGAVAHFDRSIAASPEFVAPRLERAAARLVPLLRREAPAELPSVDADLAVVERLSKDAAELALAKALRAAVAGDLVGAAAHAEEYLGVNPLSVMAHALLGHVRLRERRWAEAEEAFTRAIEAGPAMATLHDQRALSRLRQRRAEAALVDAVAATTLEPGEAHYRVNRAVILAELRRFAEARRELDAVADFAPALVVRAFVRVQLKDGGGALEDAERAVAAGAKGARLSRALAGAAVGERDRARADFDAAVGEQPDAWEPYHHRGRFLARTGDGRGALADFTRAIELGDGDPMTRVQRADVRMRTGDAEGARADLEAAVAADPKCASAHHGLGLYWRDRDAGRALECMTRAVEADGSVAAFWHGRSSLHEAAGRRAEALADADRAVGLAPRDPHVRTWRAGLRFFRGDWDGCVEDATAAIGQVIESPVPWALRGCARFQKGRPHYESAMSDFEQVFRTASKRPPESLPIPLARATLARVHAMHACAKGAQGAPAEVVFEHLERAAELGYREVENLERSPDLEGVRADARFRAVLDRMR